MSKNRRFTPRFISNTLDYLAYRRFLKVLDRIDPLTARRLQFAMDNGLTVQAVIDLEG
ncbi:hypothetical protein ABR738_15685 [Streptomyces sp. Edi4]|uniref:hypothetical protein n=1 Tax=Streptomyces sp. Edi4 TaxID=3162527 RepID=UPI003305B18A